MQNVGINGFACEPLNRFYRNAQKTIFERASTTDCESLFLNCKSVLLTCNLKPTTN